MKIVRRLGGAFQTLGEVIAHFARGQRFFLIPLLVVLFAAGLLLLATGGLSYVAPFIYTLF